MSKTLKNLALEVFKGENVIFNEVSGEQAIRNAIYGALDNKLTYNSFQQNKHKVFEILTEVVELPMQQLEKEILPGVVKFSTINFGDAKEIVLKQKKLLRVARTVLNNDLRRQKIQNENRIMVQTEWYGIAVYSELEEFLAGRVSFVELIESINRSFVSHIAKMINVCFADAVDNLSATFKVTGTFTEDEMMSLCEKVSAKNEGMPVKIYGTKTALSKIASSAPAGLIADSQKEQYASLRHFGNFYNIQLVEIAQIYDSALVPIVDDKTLYVLPDLDLIHVVQEGTDIVTEPASAENTTLAINLSVMKKLGVKCVFGSYFGAYVLA